MSLPKLVFIIFYIVDLMGENEIIVLICIYDV